MIQKSSFTMKTTIEVIVVSVIALAVSLLIRNFFGVRELLSESTSISSFLGVFGTIYAVLIGFTVFVALNRFSALSSVTEEEVDTFSAVVDLLDYVDNQPKTVDLINKNLHGYIKEILDDEWELMKKGEFSEKASNAILALIKSVNQIKVTDPSDQVALNDLIDKMTALTTWRAKRVSLSSHPIPSTLLTVVGVLSFALTIGFLFLVTTNFLIQAFIIVSVITAIILIYSVIDDLNHPFEGMWNVSKKPYERLLTSRF